MSSTDDRTSTAATDPAEEADLFLGPFEDESPVAQEKLISAYAELRDSSSPGGPAWLMWNNKIKAARAT